LKDSSKTGAPLRQKPEVQDGIGPRGKIPATMAAGFDVGHGIQQHPSRGLFIGAFWVNAGANADPFLA
jgi:hypothetical protein